MGLKKVFKRFTPEARRLIRKFPPRVKGPLRALTDEIVENPFCGKELQRELKGFRSARYTHYRVIYEYDEGEGCVTVHFVGKRTTIYDLFERYLKDVNKSN